MIQFIPHAYKTVLEIGCGEGNFRENLDLNNEYWGVEANQQSCAVATQKLDTALYGLYDEVEHNIPDNYFDLIICNDVIEHMDGHIEFLNGIKNKLSANGTLILSLPNVRQVSNLYNLLFKKDWEYKDAGVLDRTHLRFFTKKSMLRLFKETGWEIEHFKGLNRYGSNRYGPRFFLSYLLQFIYGFDSVYLQFGARLAPSTNIENS